MRLSPLILAGAAIGLLAAAAVLLIAYGPAIEPPRDRASARLPAAPIVEPAPPLPTPLALPGTREPTPAAQVVVWPPPPAPPPPGSWEAVAPVARASSLGVVGGAIMRGLAELQPRLSACFDEVVEARHGQAGFTEVRGAPPTDDSGTTVLMLELEYGQGEVRIADAPLETRGGAGDGVVACAQRVLRGQVLSAPSAVAGARQRVLFPLQP